MNMAGYCKTWDAPANTGNSIKYNLVLK